MPTPQPTDHRGVPDPSILEPPRAFKDPSPPNVPPENDDYDEGDEEAEGDEQEENQGADDPTAIADDASPLVADYRAGQGFDVDPLKGPSVAQRLKSLDRIQAAWDGLNEVQKHEPFAMHVGHLLEMGS